MGVRGLQLYIELGRWEDQDVVGRSNRAMMPNRLAGAFEDDDGDVIGLGCSPGMAAHSCK